MKINKLKKILLFFIVLSIIVSLFQVTIRINAERKENTVDVTLDYPDFYLFSATNGQNVYDTIEEMREAGATSAAVVEDCIETLYGEGKITFFNGSDLLAPSFNNILRSKLEIDKHRDIIQPSFVVVLTENRDLAERMLSNLSEDTGFIDGDGVYAIIIHSDILTAVEYGVGFDNEKIEKLKDIGFQIVLRPRYTPGNRNVETLVNTIKEFNIKSVMFYGEVITGYPDRVDELANFFNENHILTYIIESPIQKGIYSQEGLSAFIRKVHHYVVRVYSIYPAEQVKLTALEIFNRWFRSIPDRNIRVIYVKPIIGIGANYEQNLSTNKYYINKLITLWKEKGMEFGMPHPIDEVSVHWIVVFLIYLGVIALFTLYIKIILNLSQKSTLVCFLVPLLMGFFLLLYSQNTMEKLTALAAAVLITGFFSLIMFLAVKKSYGGRKFHLPDIMKNGFAISFLMLIVSLVGGLLVGAALSGSAYLLNLDMFRGVKVLYLSPFIFLIINYLYVFGADFDNEYISESHYNVIDEVKKVWDITVKGGHVVVLVLIAGIFLMYILRSGNTGVTISSLELKFRAFLEQTIVARPRVKEFLIGYPAIFFMVFAAYLMRKKWLLLFSFLGIMGSISIVDTFSHLRTTFLISFYRTLWGFAFGILLAIAAVIILYPFIKKYFINEH